MQQNKPPTLERGAPIAAPVPAGESKWPKTLGIVSLVYGILGMTCVALSTAWMAFMAPLFAAMGGMKLNMPPLFTWFVIGMSTLVLANAVLLLRGSVRLMRRHPRSVPLLQRWVVIRLVLLVIGVTFSVLTIPAQMQMQRDIQEQVNDMLERQGQPRQEINEGMIRAQVIGGVAGSAVVPAIFPMFLGFFLSRRRVKDEVSTWQMESVI